MLGQMLLQAGDACRGILKRVKSLHRRFSLLPFIQDHLKQLAFVITHYDRPVRSSLGIFSTILYLPSTHEALAHKSGGTGTWYRRLAVGDDHVDGAAHPLEPSDASSAFHATAEMLMPLSLGMGFAFFHLLLMYICSAVDPSVLPDLTDTRACAPLSSTLTAVAEASGARDSSTSDTVQHARELSGNVQSSTLQDAMSKPSHSAQTV